MYNWLQLAKILSKFYRKKLKAADGDSTIIPLPLTLGRFLACGLDASKLKIGVEETKSRRPCCRDLIIALFEEALGEQQMTEILTSL